MAFGPSVSTTSMAQTAAVLVVETLGPNAAGKLVYFMSIEGAKFRRPVVPGDQVRLEIDILNLRAAFCRLQARALVDDKLAVEAILSSAMVSR